MFFYRPGKVLEEEKNPLNFGNVLEISYIHMFIYAEF